MSIFKPSNFYPNLEEVDITKDCIFTCQVNTSGTSVNAYKINMLTDNNIDVFSTSKKVLSSSIRNKDILKAEIKTFPLRYIGTSPNFTPSEGDAYYNPSTNVLYVYTSNEWVVTTLDNSKFYSLVDENGVAQNKIYTVNTDVTSLAPYLSLTMENGKNYKWNIRAYENTSSPQTVVCKGFIVGSTTNVIWTTNNDKLALDRWVEIATTVSGGVPDNMMGILLPNTENLTYPSDGVYKERHQITWIEKELGNNKNITKLELDKKFKYNYKDGTVFNIYQVSDQHGYSNVFVDPNDQLEIGTTYIELFNNGTSVDSKKRKIIGYTEDTGEIRVQENFTTIPTNGLTYKLYKYENSTYSEKTFTSSNLVGGAAITGTFTLMSNNTTAGSMKLFIQPNINIKSDDTNPCEIIFENGTRVAITKTTSNVLVPNKIVDITLDKLDNTQWMVTTPTLLDGAINYPIIPQSNYIVYTSFMDNIPENVFYARKEPSVTLQYKNLNADESAYINISSSVSKPWRNIEFKTIWDADTEVKNYFYELYDINHNLVKKSEVFYDNLLSWGFKGLKSGNIGISGTTSPNTYYIQITIEDEFGKRFVSEICNFLIEYATQSNDTTLEVNKNYETASIDVDVIIPLFVESTDTTDKITSTIDDVNFYTNELNIGEGKVLNYTQTLGTETTPTSPIVINSTFSYLSHFKLKENFPDAIVNDEGLTICKIANKNIVGNIDTYDIQLFSLEYFLNGNDGIYQNPNQFCIKVFKNGSNIPLNCFNNGVNNYFNISSYCGTGAFFVPTSVNYALQDNSTNQYIIVDTLPSVGEVGKKYVLREEYTTNNTVYFKGIYTYNASFYSWNFITNVDYVFIDNLSSLLNSTYNSLNAPENCRDTSTNDLKYIDENNIFIEGVDYYYLNKIVLSNKWFVLYFKVNAPDNVAVLSEINDNAPSEPYVGQKYYSPTLKKIYTFTNNGWDTGAISENGIYYYCESDSKKYIWNGTDLVEDNTSWDILTPVRCIIDIYDNKEDGVNA